MNLYKKPNWVIKIIQGEEFTLFNWINNNSVTIYDKSHPCYMLLNSDHLYIKTSQLSESHQEDISWLLSEKFLITSEDQVQIKNPFPDDILQLILLPAGEACNLDCVYCYENHTDNKSMNTNHIDTFINLIKKSNKSFVKIDYFGGEPMLNIPFIENFANALQLNNIKFSASITTNGTLLNAKNLEKLYNSGVKSFQITLDGWEDLHNSLRPAKRESINSFQKVCNAISTLDKSPYKDINIVIRLNLNEDSLKGDGFSLFREIIENTIPKNDKRFFILPKIIGNYSASNLVENQKAEKTYCRSKEIASHIIDEFEKYIVKYFRSANLLMLTNPRGLSCYANNPNSFVITPDLKVYKCTVAFNDPTNLVGFLNENGILKKTINFNEWVKDFSDKWCLSCFLYKSCQGNSCALENIKKRAKICPPAKHNPEKITQHLIEFYKKVPYENN